MNISKFKRFSFLLLLMTNFFGVYSTETFDLISSTDIDLTGSVKSPAVESCSISHGTHSIGCKTHVTFEIKNIAVNGPEAGPFNISFYVSDDDKISDDDILIVENYNQYLFSDDFVNYSIIYSSKISIKGKFIISFIDPENIIEEDNELNNTITSQITSVP